ncbi:MAG: SUMF1/EgtB/PvdO family nonheme iron enzyme [Verrucomicrobia bacterium]|nr:SUMF1/EgtB/PvdO family nonheme iron enzyme [Verrucomicrobiota bacterium]
MPSAAPKALLLLLAPLLLCGCGKSPAGKDSNKSQQGGGSQTAPTAKAARGKPFQNTLGMKFVSVPGTDALFGIWETRVRDFKAYVDSLGDADWSRTGYLQRLDHPIGNVSWHDAVAFCRWLTLRERKLGLIGAGDRYRLPTDREWSTAAGPDKYPWGNKWPNLDDWKKLPGHAALDGDNTAPVGSHAPNKFGLHDLGGNVFEWCQDWYVRGMNSPDARIENKRLEDDGDGVKYKALRGASWIFRDPITLQLSYRACNLPESRNGLYGFRCVLVIEAD